MSYFIDEPVTTVQRRLTISDEEVLALAKKTLDPTLEGIWYVNSVATYAYPKQVRILLLDMSNDDEPDEDFWLGDENPFDEALAVLSAELGAPVVIPCWYYPK